MKNLYEVRHQLIKRRTDLWLDDALANQVTGGRVSLRAQIIIWKKFKRKLKISKEYDARGIRIKKKTNTAKKRTPSSFAHRNNDGLSACEKGCSYCEVGQYEKCRN